MICFGRISFARSSITSLPQSIATCDLRGSTAGTSFAPIGDMPRNVIAVAIVFAVNWPPQAPAPGHARLFELADFLFGHFARGVRAGRFEDVLNRHIVAVEMSGHDRAAVERERGNIQARESHHRAGNGLVAAADGDDCVERVRAHEQFDGIGDHFAGHERAFHAFGAHRDAVGNHDRVAFDGSAAGRANPFLDFFGEAAKMHVARRHVRPGVRHGHERLRQVRVGESGCF